MPANFFLPSKAGAALSSARERLSGALEALGKASSGSAERGEAAAARKAELLQQLSALSRELKLLGAGEEELLAALRGGETP